jgi:hypothetical protein
VIEIVFAMVVDLLVIVVTGLIVPVIVTELESLVEEVVIPVVMVVAPAGDEKEAGVGDVGVDEGASGPGVGIVDASDEGNGVEEIEDLAEAGVAAVGIEGAREIVGVESAVAN